ncbi:MAG: hypothetical protein LBK18_03920 [Prevotellaceae bacterium]|jgi:hypothetical protein|nr:hypothetical protein [Prevotellaceae bacterium]
MKKIFKLLANITAIGCAVVALAACSKDSPADDPYELPDPVEPDIAYTYSVEVSSPYAWTADGMTWTAVDGSQLNKITVSANDTVVAYFEIVTEENTATLAGTYPVKAVNSLERAIVQGQFMNLLWLGMFDMAIESGSYYLNGETKMFIRDGSISITDNSGALTITGSDLAIQDISTEMAFGNLSDLGKVNYPNMTLVGNDDGEGDDDDDDNDDNDDGDDNAAYTYSVEASAPYTYTTDGTNWIPVDGTQLNKISVFAGSEQVGYFEVVTAPSPASLAGTYELKDPVDGVSQIAVGSYMNMSWFGGPDMVIKGGSYYVKGGEEMFIRAGTGGVTITITDAGGVLGISGTGLPIQDVTQMFWALLPAPGSINYQNVTLAGGGGAQLELPNLLSAAATDLAAVSGGALTGYTVTLKLGEAGVTVTPGAMGVTIGGDGSYISIDFSRDAATLPAGTYNIVDNATAAVGDAIGGYYLELFPGFGFDSGTFLKTVTAGTEGAPTYITGGTVTVAEAGGVYTVTVNATTGGGEAVNAVYTGVITIQ